MKNAELIEEGLSFIDAILKNKGRQNIVGTLITGIGSTITSLGVCVLLNKPSNVASESEEVEEKTE